MTFLKSLASPDSVSIFAQAPGIGFVAFTLSLLPVPIPGRVRLDLADTEDVVRSYDITRNPVERVVIQNKIRQPEQLTITGMLSADSLTSPLASFGLLRLDKRELQKLRDLADRAEPLFVVTPERSYANMMVRELREHYDANTGRGVALTLSFEEVQIIRPGFVDSVLDVDALGVGSAATTDLGPQTPDTTAANPLTTSGPQGVSATEKASITATTPELAGVLL